MGTYVKYHCPSSSINYKVLKVGKKTWFQHFDWAIDNGGALPSFKNIGEIWRQNYGGVIKDNNHFRVTETTWPENVSVPMILTKSGNQIDWTAWRTIDGVFGMSIIEQYDAAMALKLSEDATYQTFNQLMILKTGVCQWTPSYEFASAGQGKACTNNDNILSYNGGTRYTELGMTAKRCNELCVGHPSGTCTEFAFNDRGTSPAPSCEFFSKCTAY